MELRRDRVVEQLYLAEVKIRVESRPDRVIEGSCGFCLLEYERKFMNPILLLIISMLWPLRSGAS